MSKRIKNIVFLGIIIVLVAAGFYLIYRMNRIVDSNAFFKSMMAPMGTQILRQFLFMSALIIFGMGMMLCFNRYFELKLILLLGYIVGTLLWALLSVVILCLGIPFTPWSVIIACILALVAALLLGKPEKLKREEWIQVGSITLLSVAAAFFFSTLCVFRFSYDSFIYINMGERLADFGRLTSELIPYASGFSAFTSMLFAPAQFFGYDFSQGLNLMLNTQFTLAVAFFIYWGLKKTLSNKVALITARAAFFLLAGANMYFELMYWPMSNLLTAMTLFFMLYFAYRSNESKHGPSLWLSLFFAVCLVLIRTENSLLMLVMLFPLSLMAIPRRRLAIYVTVALGFVLLWYARFFLVAGISFSEGAFLTIDRALPVIAAYLGMLVYLLFVSNMRWVNNNKGKVEGLFYLAFVLAIVGLSVLKPDFIGANLYATMLNMFRAGGWGLSLYLFFGLFLLRAVLPLKWDLWDKVCLSFILFYIAIYLLRAMPLREGYGDSGNRYFAHILPIATYALVMKIVPFYAERAGIITKNKIKT